MSQPRFSDEIDVRQIEGPQDPLARADYLLDRLLPPIKSRDAALDRLYFIDPDNDVTRMASIAAAVWILRNTRRS